MSHFQAWLDRHDCIDRSRAEAANPGHATGAPKKPEIIKRVGVPKKFEIVKWTGLTEYLIRILSAYRISPGVIIIDDCVVGTRLCGENHHSSYVCRRCEIMKELANSCWYSPIQMWR